MAGPACNVFHDLGHEEVVGASDLRVSLRLAPEVELDDGKGFLTKHCSASPWFGHPSGELDELSSEDVDDMRLHYGGGIESWVPSTDAKIHEVVALVVGGREQLDDGGVVDGAAQQGSG